MRDMIEIYQQHNKKWRFRCPANDLYSKGRYASKEEAVRVAGVVNRTLYCGAYRLKVRRVAT